MIAADREPIPLEAPAAAPGTPLPPPSPRSLLRRLGPTGALGVCWLAAPPLVSILLFTYIKSISAWLRSHPGIDGLAIYALAFAVAAGLGLLPTYAQALLGGWAFGFALGFPAALTGFAGAAAIGYAVARTVSRNRVQQVIADNPKARAIRDALIGHGFWKTLGVVTLLRFPPNSPFALTNLGMAAAGVPPLPFIVGTILGMAPRTALAVYIGAGLDQLTSESVKQAVPRWALFAGFAAALLAVLILGHIAQKALARLGPPEGGTPAPASPGKST